MCVRILSNSSIVKLKAEMVVTTCLVMPTTCFGMPTNEIKGTMPLIRFRRGPGSNPACGRNFFA